MPCKKRGIVPEGKCPRRICPGDMSRVKCPDSSARGTTERFLVHRTYSQTFSHTVRTFYDERDNRCFAASSSTHYICRACEHRTRGSAASSSRRKMMTDDSSISWRRRRITKPRGEVGRCRSCRTTLRGRGRSQTRRRRVASYADIQRLRLLSSVVMCKIENAH